MIEVYEVDGIAPEITRLAAQVERDGVEAVELQQGNGKTTALRALPGLIERLVRAERKVRTAERAPSYVVYKRAWHTLANGDLPLAGDDEVAICIAHASFHDTRGPQLLSRSDFTMLAERCL